MYNYNKDIIQIYIHTLSHFDYVISLICTLSLKINSGQFAEWGKMYDVTLFHIII